MKTEKFRVFNSTFRKPDNEYHVDYTRFESGEISGERDGKPWKIEYHYADITGTNEYADMIVTAEDPYTVLDAQLCDGYWECSNFSFAVRKWDEKSQKWLEPWEQLSGGASQTEAAQRSGLAVQG